MLSQQGGKGGKGSISVNILTLALDKL